jgi:hypothetical protein
MAWVYSNSGRIIVIKTVEGGRPAGHVQAGRNLTLPRKTVKAGYWDFDNS